MVLLYRHENRRKKSERRPLEQHMKAIDAKENHECDKFVVPLLTKSLYTSFASSPCTTDDECGIDEREELIVGRA